MEPSTVFSWIHSVELADFLKARADESGCSTQGLVRETIDMYRGVMPPIAQLGEPPPRLKTFSERTTSGIMLREDAANWLQDIALRCGPGVGRTIVLAHLVTERFRISPLTPGPVPVQRLKKYRIHYKTHSNEKRPTDELVQSPFSLAPVAAKYLTDVAKGGGSSRSTKEIIRLIINAKMGQIAFTRTGKPLKPLAAKPYPKKSVRFTTKMPIAEYIEQLATHLGAGERTGVLSALVMEFLGISPLTKLSEKFAVRTDNPA